MSNPEGNLKKMTRWHWATLLGIAVAVVLAGIAFLVFSSLDPDEPPAVEPPADSAGTVGVSPQVLEPGETPNPTEAVPTQDMPGEGVGPDDGSPDGGVEADDSSM